MNILMRVKSYFYFEEQKRSDLQHAHDFCEFPPSPLSCQGLDREFVLVRTRGIGGMLFNLLILKQFLQVRRVEEIHASLHDTWLALEAARSQITRAMSELRGTINTPAKRILFVMVFVPILSLVGLVLVPWSAFKFAPVFANLYRRIPRGLGYFVPFFIRETRIVVKANALEKRRDGDAIIAHEHLHLLQHRHGAFGDKKSNCGEMLLDVVWKDNRHLLYLLERNEVEARLHEIVLCHYRAVGQLPMTLDGFVAMLIACDAIGPIVAEAVGSQPTPGAIRYHVRSASVADDVEWILSSIATQELRHRFITEVLPVMYANLIGYYGDETSRRSFLQALARPNLHDALYLQSAEAKPLQ